MVSLDALSFPQVPPHFWRPGVGPADAPSSNSAYLNEEWGQPAALVLLHGEGHWWIAPDHRDDDGDDPPVVWFDDEVRDDVRLASTFAEFRAGLGPVPEL